MTTINDICRKVGFSKATVSRVLNNTGQVKQSTKDIIYQAMEEMNYRPSSIAQALATNSSNSIGLVLSDFDGDYFGRLLKHASSTADKLGKQLVIADGHNDAEQEKKAVHFLVDRKCDIIILYSRKLSNDDLIKLKQTSSVPIINVGHVLTEDAGFSIGIDHQQAATLAMQYLVDNHHQQIGYIGPTPVTSTSIIRFNTFRDTVLELQNINQDKKESQDHLNPRCYNFTDGYTASEGYHAATELLKRPQPLTAIFAASDGLAIGVLKAIKEANLRIPEDISLIGIDNDVNSQFMSPSLTTIHLPIANMIKEAFSFAEQVMVDNELKPKQVSLKGSLIERESTRPNTV
ncbi:LacI family transcriptional regulator [Vibrio sp. SS-MA-C1-2]|uniref:LacI family DNA-binding transcriptional regulator n=1 Tax=Vibrio sp. SS-MA-C1-2 TaxID=2908646 RepID=UPI001F48CBD8|nr:LacI family DNA-binding transcriptional regulator [Vibrio sp. SS-MA-C1-2]UJF17448.1 LacI family transcriptional regulator [Vibrio sp. SS-MA-C1-2]